MASSFIDQTPVIVHLVQKLKANRVLDIGKGFGKYGFLIHEYVGINNTKRIDCLKPLKDQSTVQIDAVEVDKDLMLPHLDQIYEKVYFGNILDLYKELPAYDLVLMIDIIEHIDKQGAIAMLKQFLQNGSYIVIATPIDFFEQKLYESDYENHVSHWTFKDFAALGYLSHQNINAGAIYLLSSMPMDIRGFGNSLIKRIRRIAKAVRNEL